MAPSGRSRGLCSATSAQSGHALQRRAGIGNCLVSRRPEGLRQFVQAAGCTERMQRSAKERVMCLLLVPVSVPPPQSAAPVVHPCIKVSAPQLYLSFQEARQPEPQRFRRKELGSNERFWQQSPKWNVSKPHACPLGLSVNKPLSIRGRRGPRPGAETAY